VTRPQGLRRFAGPPQQAATRPAAAAPPPATAGPASAGQPAGAGQPGAAGEEHCEFCAAGIPAGHGHVADLEQSSLMCACRACYLLFTQPGAGRAKYRSVPDRYLRDPDRTLSPAEWDQLQIPVGLAFFLYRSDPGELGGFYPSPAGATQCALDLPAWQRLAAAHPLLGQAEPDVEAVLISQDESAGLEYFIVPVDACYELAGRMRMLWRGFDGGTEARQSIAEFLAGVRRRAKTAPRDPSHG
jgi:Family of unknown function (DUF5947)